MQHQNQNNHQFALKQLYHRQAAEYLNQKDNYF